MMMMMSAKMFSVQEINFLSPEKIALFSNGAHLSLFLKINQSDIFLSKKLGGVKCSFIPLQACQEFGKILNGLTPDPVGFELLM